MADYYADNLLKDIKRSACHAETRLYVDVFGINMEITGSRIKQNGGAVIFSVDETSEHHARERIGEYKNTVHPTERREA